MRWKVQLSHFRSKFKFKFAAWHVGALVALAFLSLNLQRLRLESGFEAESDGSSLKSIDRFFYDRLFRDRGTRPMSTKVGILAIDEKSIAMFGRWPFPRDSYSEAFKNLKAAGVKWIGLDVLFSEPERPLLEDTLAPLENILFSSTSPSGVLDPRKFIASVTELLKTSPGDLALRETFRSFGNVVHAVALLNPDEIDGTSKDWNKERDRLAPSLVTLVETSAAANKENKDKQELLEQFYPLMSTQFVAGEKHIAGSISSAVDDDGIVRKVHLIHKVKMPNSLPGSSEHAFLPSLSLQLVSKYLNRKIRIRMKENYLSIALVAANGDALEIPTNVFTNQLPLNHYGNHISSNGKDTPLLISLADATENKLPNELPEILIMGSTTMGIADIRPSPLNAVANGVEHHVAAVDNILRQDFLKRGPSSVVAELLIAILAATILIIILSKAEALVCLVLLVLTYITLEILNQKIFFARGNLLQLGFLHIQNFSIFTSMILYKFFVEEREKRKVRGAFQQYLNPAVINQLLSSPDGLKLGGEKRELTVFFSDVRGFTSISERLAPEVLANLLNEYFTPMTDIVLQSGGLLDKYIGDALMAVWGAPLHMPDHADRALHSSLRMLDALDKLTESWKERNLPTIDIGCGINTGPMVVGNMGSTQRFDYTVLGDAVNLGSRLEGITKEYGVRVICSNSTRQNLKRPEDFILRELDWIKVKGKNEPITIYEVMRFHPEKKDVALKTKELFEQGLKLYRERDFAGAMQQMLKILQYAAQDGPASVFLERCEYYAENPPTENWDGVWVMKTK